MTEYTYTSGFKLKYKSGFVFTTDGIFNIIEYVESNSDMKVSMERITEGGLLVKYENDIPGSYKSMRFPCNLFTTKYPFIKDDTIEKLKNSPHTLIDDNNDHRPDSRCFRDNNSVFLKGVYGSIWTEDEVKLFAEAFRKVGFRVTCIPKTKKLVNYDDSYLGKIKQ